MEDVEEVRIWRAPDHDRILCMHGITTHYAVDPVGELVIGVCATRGYRLQHGRATDIVDPGQLVVIDPSRSHSGTPAEDGAWEARLLIIELANLQAAATDEDSARFDFDFPSPKVSHALMTERFLAVHRVMERSASALERQSQLTAFLQDLAALSPSGNGRARREALDNPALRRACEFLRTDITRNASLDELAVVAGMGKYRLVRLFKAGLGVPPHAFQVSQRVMLARRLIERGTRLVDVALEAGFVDQSHLHRHFQRRLGMTPGQYALALGRTPLELPVAQGDDH